jgi:hypothetical protein
LFSLVEEGEMVVLEVVVGMVVAGLGDTWKALFF